MTPDQRLSTIFQIARTMSRTRDLAVILPQFLASLIDALPAADAGLLLLYDPAIHCLKTVAARGHDETIMQQLYLAVNESLPGQAFQSGQIQFSATPEDTARAMATMTPHNYALLCAATVGVHGARSVVCVPLITGHEAVGVLVLENLHQAASFTTDDLTFLTAAAELVTLSIENRRLSQALQTTYALEEANRLQDERISTLAHEMRTPLTSIKGYTTALLMEDVAFSRNTQRDFLQIIDEECGILQNLIHDLLESSMIDAGLLRLDPQPVLLPRLTREVITEYGYQAWKHQFVVDFADDFPIVDADPLRIAQVLRNLIDNALSYSPDGGLIVVRGEAHSHEVIVSVSDQGVGIAPEHLNRLFEKYFRVESGLVRHMVGSGLGLSIAHTIVQSHNGRIWAESQLGAGATLYFALPRMADRLAVGPDGEEDGV